MNITERLADFAANLQYGDIPADVLRVQKQSVLDNIAIMSGGADGDGCRAFVEYAVQSAAGGHGEAHVLGYDMKLPAELAAFANASMVMALDFSDTSATATIHPNTSTFAVCLALAEKLGGISGEDFLTAMVAGSEVATRLARAAAPSRFAMYGMYMPPVFTSFGATAAACRLMGLSAQQIIDAWSLNLSQYICSSELTNNKETPIRSIREAFGARSAYSSAMLAAAGIRGFADPFEGKQGFYRAYFQGDYDAEKVLEGLWDNFQAGQLIFKPWPCCMGNHGCINAALNIMAQHHPDVNDIVSIHAEVPTVARVVLEPFADKKRPQNAINAKYSIPFTVSTALIDGQVTLDSFDEASLQREDILALAEKFSYTLNEEWDKLDEYKTGGRLTITMADGTEYTELVTKTLGDPANPMTDEAFEAKFYSCMSRAAVPQSREMQAQILACVRALDELPDMRQLAEML